MNEEKFEKTLKDVKWTSIVILILVVILYILTISTADFKIIQMVSFVLQVLLLVATAIGCENKMMYGPVCGTIVSILMILSLSIIDMIIGIFLLIECINLIRYLKK